MPCLVLKVNAARSNSLTNQGWQLQNLTEREMFTSILERRIFESEVNESNNPFYVNTQQVLRSISLGVSFAY